MKKIICDLPNASELINGIQFEPTLDGAMMSVEAVSDEIAAQFKGIPGYHFAAAEPATSKKAKADPNAGAKE